MPEPTSLNFDGVVVRRLGSDRTHVARIGQVWRAHFVADYWAPVDGTQAACGVRIPEEGVIMRTGTKVRCRACAHLTGVTEQSPAVAEVLDAVCYP